MPFLRELAHPVPGGGRVVAGVLHRHHVVGIGRLTVVTIHVVIDMEDQKTRILLVLPRREPGAVRGKIGVEMIELGR